MKETRREIFNDVLIPIDWITHAEIETYIDYSEACKRKKRTLIFIQPPCGLKYSIEIEGNVLKEFKDFLDRFKDTNNE